ncbi:MAG: hypothetical protein AB2A00_18350 [Myxococcota bacterium]
MKRVLPILTTWALVITAPNAHAQVSSADNLCVDAGGMGEPCSSEADCATRSYATDCVQLVANDPASRSCQAPCGRSNGNGGTIADRAACGLGETCVASPGDGSFYCKPAKFRMDLNLLDQCISHFLRGTEPSLGSTNECSLEANLNRFLDQDSDLDFDIFDTQRCIQAFLAQPECDTSVGACPSDDLTFCTSDDDCGPGLHCGEGNFCTRECGFIASREPGVGLIERQCAGRLKTCNYERGRCDVTDVELFSCAVDRDCPSGSYCFLGRCAETCSRAIDCPDSQWFCTANNRCRVRPSPDAEPGFVFDPRNYAILFGTNDVELTPIENETEAPLLIMDLTTKKEVRGNPSVGFGYRVEVTYALKQDQRCNKSPDEWTLEERADCLIDDTEEFVTALNPYGTIFAVGQPGLRIRLNTGAADRLTPGSYMATVSVIFDNGYQDRFLVRYVKTTPSGEYTGTMNVYVGREDNSLNGSRPMVITAKLDIRPTVMRWTDLLAAENMGGGEDLVDLTEGYLVHGLIHGNEALPFAWPNATSPGQNEIPVKGLYSPQLGRMRLLSVIDIPANFCISQAGPCDPSADDLKVQNLFGRDLRRIIQFAGTFDDLTRRFFGIYRERVAGLIPTGELTLDGSFVLSQKLPDESEVPLTDPLRPVSKPATISFPSLSALRTAVDAEVTQYCASHSAERSKFSSASAYRTYLGQPDFPVFDDVVEFKALVQDGLDNILSSDDRADDALTLYDFLTGRIVLCGEEEVGGEGPGTTPAPACVDEEKLRCGLALYRRAIINQFVDTSDLGNAGTGELQLFCTATLPTSGCGLPAADHRALRTLQEHNRFHQELSQATKFQADRDVSDAFFALYRNRVNPFTQGAALSFKADKLKSAFELHNSLLSLFTTTTASSVLFNWPMSRFQGIGTEWLRQMQVLARDRLEAQAQLVDLRRRVFASSTSGDQLLGEHLAQQEYLLQAYLIALQRQWQGADFNYAGDAKRAFDQVSEMLLQLHESRNPLGISPDRVFFENSDPTKVNWHNYLSVLIGDDGDGGLIAKGHAEIDAAVTNLQASLQDVDALEDSIFDINDSLEGTLTELCGDSTPRSCTELINLFNSRNGGNATQVINTITQNLTTNCSFSLAPSIDCGGLVTAFKGSVATDPPCPLNALNHTISVRGEPRACVGGEMGSLLQQREALLIERDGMVREMQTLFKQIEEFLSTRQYIEGINIGRRLKWIITRAIVFGLTVADKGTKTAEEITSEALEGADCVIIAGFAVGTSCGGSVAAGVGKSAITAARGIVEALLEAVKDELENILEIFDMEYDFAVDRREAQRELADMKTGVDGFYAAYKANQQALFDLEVQIEQVRFLAEDAAAGTSDRLGLLLDHLVGRESGSVLVGNHLVGQSARTFRRALNVTYRMVLAFAHRYNLPDSDVTALTTQVFQAVTLDDIESVINTLAEMERTYCSRESIDCDAFNNLNVMRFSLRDELFPQLRDIVDPVTGSVVTRGQQFHNIITSPPYLRRRVRGVWPVDQIEIPFSIFLQKQDNMDPPRWLLDPTQCNHILDGDASGDPSTGGTVAVNVVGTNLGDSSRSVSYELGRGHIDYLRACHAEAFQAEIGTDPILDYPIETQVVGYAPESVEGQLITPPTYYVRSGELPACINEAESRGVLPDASCWRFFARDRALAAPDYTLYIPLSIDGAETGNTWVTGEGLPEAQRPVIEDIVVYLRYRSRPISEP